MRGTLLVLKCILTCAAASLALLCGSATAAVPTQGQSARVQVGSGTTATATFATNPTAGNTVLVFVQARAGVSSVIDNGSPSDTFTRDAYTTAGKGAYVYRANGINLPSSGSYEITVTAASSTTIQAQALEFANLASGAPTATHTGSGTSTSVNTGSVTSSGDAVFFGGFSDNNGGTDNFTFTSGSSGFVEDFRNTNGYSYWPAAEASARVSGAATKNITWTLSASTAWGAAIAVYPGTSGTDTTPPSAPANLTATAGDTQVALGWGASIDNAGVAGYRIYRDGTQVGSVSASTLSYTDSGLTDGTAYSYTVKAIDAAGNLSAASNTATATPRSSIGTPQPYGPPGTWTLTFDDEFNGTSLDTSKWSPCWFYPTCGSMNNVSTSPANVSVGGGYATLTLASSSSGATIETNPNGGAGTGYQFQYGVVEARIWFPGDGTHCYNWPAWWTDGQSWPANGENDIAEVLDGPMTVNYHSSSGAHNQGAVPGYWCGGFHTYTLNRQNGHADVYFDGTLVKSYSTDDGGAPQYLIINVGSSSSYPAYGTAAQVKVDYVRAWQ